jgi:sugar lactone lactonase YvrE
MLNRSLVHLLSWAVGLTMACNSAMHAGAPRPDGSLPGTGETGGASGAGGANGGDAGSTSALKLVAGKLGGRGDLDGIGAAARFRSPFGVASDGAGHLFVTDETAHVVRRIDLATGTVTTVAGSPGHPGKSDGTGTTARFDWPMGIVSDGAGNLFVADSNNSAIRKIVVATGAVTTFVGTAGISGGNDGVGAAARFGHPCGLAMVAGTLYVTDGNAIRKVIVATGAVSTVALVDLSFDDGSGFPQFADLAGVTSDGAGHLFVADRMMGLIRTVDLATGAITTLAGGGLQVTYIDRPDGSRKTKFTGGDADGIGTDAWFYAPTDVVSDGAGNLIVADQGNCALRNIVIATGLVTTLMGSPDHCAELGDPTSLVLDGAGNLFMTDEWHLGVRKVVLATHEVTVVAGGSTENSGDADGIGEEARFSTPRGMASDGEGNIFIADIGNGIIRKLEVATGAVTLFAGSPEDRDTSVDGIGPAARFRALQGIATDGLGNLFVAEQTAIRQIVIATGAVTTLAGSLTTEGSADGVGAAARFYSANAVVADGAGSLYVGDISTIRKVVVATGEVTTFAGMTGGGGCADGVGTAALLWGSSGLALDGAGNLYVVDTNCSTIRKIVLATRQVTTIAGAYAAFGSADGLGASAEFDHPVGIVYDKKGHLFVADVNNHTVRRIDVATQAVSTVVGRAERMGVVLGGLPAGLSSPTGLAFGPSGELLIADSSDDSILAAWF